MAAAGSLAPPCRACLTNPAVGFPWHARRPPDCNVAEPVIYERLEALPPGRDAVLLRAYVGDKPAWRDPAHPWRVDPRFALRGVPTLIRWEGGGAAARLGDDEAHLKDKVDALLGLGAGGN